MSDWPQDLWQRLEKVVQGGRFAAANEEFMVLKVALLKSSPADLAVHAAHAELAWQFLIGFAEKKAFYRSYVSQIVTLLLSQSGSPWREAYVQNKELRDKATSLHEDIQVALRAVEDTPVSTVAPQAPATLAPKNGGKPIEWPKWETIEAVVRMESFKGANEEFVALRTAVMAAGPADLASQVGHADVVWRFLVGFAEKKALYRSQLAQVVQMLLNEHGWHEALEALTPDVKSRIEALPDVLRQAFGCSADRADVPSGSTANNSKDLAEGILQDSKLSEQKDEMPRSSSSDFRSLEERLSAMMGYVEGLAASEPVQSLSAEKEEQSEAETRRADEVRQAEAQRAEEAQKAGEARQAEAQRAEEAKGQETKASTTQPAEMTQARNFLKSAKDVEAEHPLIAHYLSVHAVELLVEAKKRGASTAESDRLLFATFEEAEERKKSLDLTDGPAKMEAFALKQFENSTAADNMGASPPSVVLMLYASSIYFDALVQFYSGGLPSTLAEKSNYAKGRAMHLRNCLKTGSKPAPPAPPAKDEGYSAHPAPIVPQAVPEVAPQPIAAVPLASSSRIPGLSKSKRQSEARREARDAASAINSDNLTGARKHIEEALAMLEGLE